MNTLYNKSRELARLNNFKNSEIMPFRYVFVLTNLCNLKCSFCFQDKKLNKDSLSLQDWKDIIIQLPKGSHITLTGGEPLLFKEFEKLIDFIPESISFNVITNGLLLSEKVSNILLKSKSFKVLSISIDDVGNSSRDFTEDQWQKLVTNVKYFSNQKRHLKSNAVLDIKSVVHSQNQTKICSLSTYVSQYLRADTHMFMFLKGNPIQHADVMFDYSLAFYENERYEEYDILMLEEQLSRLGILAETNSSTQVFLHPKYTDIYNKYQPKIQAKQLANKTHIAAEYQTCLSPWESVHINNDGNLFPCLAVKWGNTKENSLSEIINASIANKFRDDITACGTLPACKHCGYLKLSEQPNS